MAITRSSTAHARTMASLLAKRWLLLLQRQAPPARNGQYALSALECDIVCRLWSWTWSDPRTRVMLDDTYSVDEWLSRIVVYVIKFYGVAYGPDDRALVEWIRCNGFDFPITSTTEWVDKELETLDILCPHILHLWDDEDKENVAPAW